MYKIDNIFNLIKTSGLQQKDLSNILGVTQSKISDWKKGRFNPTLEHIAKLSQYFNVSTDYLLGLTDNPAPASAVSEELSDEEKLYEEYRQAVLFSEPRPLALGYGHRIKPEDAKRLTAISFKEVKNDRYFRNLGWKILLESKSITSFPVDVFAFARERGIETMPYTELAPILDLDVDEIKDIYGDKGFCFISGDEANVAAYNDKREEGEIRWCVAHEIFHFLLGHVTEENRVLKYVGDNKHDMYDKEVQNLTRRVLCPSIILHRCKAYEVDEIMRLCGISEEAAQHRSKHIKMLLERDVFCTDVREKRVEEKFSEFIREYNN